MNALAARVQRQINPLRAMQLALPQQPMQANPDHFKNGRFHYIVVHVELMVIQVITAQEIVNLILLQ